MRSPSARVLNQTCDVYKIAPSYDEDAGLDADESYADTPDYDNEPVAANPDYGARDEQTMQNPTSVLRCTFVFARDLDLALNDKIVWGGADWFVEGWTDMAGRGAAYGVVAARRD